MKSSKLSTGHDPGSLRTAVSQHPVMSLLKQTRVATPRHPNIMSQVGGGGPRGLGPPLGHHELQVIAPAGDTILVHATLFLPFLRASGWSATKAISRPSPSTVLWALASGASLLFPEAWMASH